MFPLNSVVSSIMAYESSIWASADILRSSVGVKAGDMPDFMIPFFALRLLEAKIIQVYNREYQSQVDQGKTPEEARLATIEELQDRPYYNKVILEDRMTLNQVVSNDLHFSQQFTQYLEGFTDEVQHLLGIVNSDKTHNLNLRNIVRSLEKFNALFQYARCWSNVDFAPFPMTDVVMLEEHIKGKWAEMSAETAGEHYTPYDIVDLAIAIFKLYFRMYKFSAPYIKIYDPTCGGGGAITRIAEHLGPALKKEVRVYGQELNGALAALAKIDAMTRDDETYIEQGNTLLTDMFNREWFNAIFANPPYGVSWKNEEADIKKQADGRLGKAGYPSVSDGQLLFLEHISYKLAEVGFAVVILNGSPLFSGDAGSGESEIRKYLLDNDLVEGIVQLPTGEFFNTGIGTYAWVLVSKKLPGREGKVVVANAEAMFKKLKKNFGDKNKEIDLQQVESLILAHMEEYTSSEHVKILPKEQFYYNRQPLKRLVSKESAPAINQGDKSIPLELHHVQFKSGEFFAAATLESCKEVIDKEFVAALAQSANEPIARIVTKDNAIITVLDEETVAVEGLKGVKDGTYCGAVKLTAKLKKATKIKPASAELIGCIEPIWVKDEERILFSSDKDTNQKQIEEFLTKWVDSNLNNIQLLPATVGVEINFNSLFSKGASIRASQDILKELADLDIRLSM